MTIKEQIMEILNNSSGLTDTELEHILKKPHQTINMCCRQLADEGVIIRTKTTEKGGRICNYLISSNEKCRLHRETPSLTENVLDEESIKAVLEAWLEQNGWKSQIAWGKSHGADIDARRENERWIIEVKGPGSRQAMRVNYFISILGEILQRMDDKNARYSIAFPDMKVYRYLWNKLPDLAKKRTTVDLLLVDVNGNIDILD